MKSDPVEIWRKMVEEESTQSDRMREGYEPSNDQWRLLAERFRPNRMSIDDPVTRRLVKEIQPHNSVMDIGSGAGRMAIPISSECKWITAVEPSQSMGVILNDEITKSNIKNISVVHSTWEEAEIQQADVAICVQVLHSIKCVRPFIDKMLDKTRKKILIILDDNPPHTQADSLWTDIHGEERRRLPSFRELMSVFWGMGIFPALEMFPIRQQRGFSDYESALNQISSRLFLEANTCKYIRLQQILPDRLAYHDGRLRIRDASPQRPALITICIDRL